MRNILSLNPHIYHPAYTKMNKIVRKEINFAGRNLVLETGELAIQADMAVKASYGDTVILATVVHSAPMPDIDFFPLTVNYEEKLYASGTIKSSRFVKRDGRATDEAIISKRLIDHAVRPLFPKEYMDEVQVVATILSLDVDADPEFTAMTAVSAALSASELPWDGPMVSLRIGKVDGNYIINPSSTVLEDGSKLNMMISFVGDQKKFLAVEAEADILPEDDIFGAINFARDGADPVFELIKEFAMEVNPEHTVYKYEPKALSAEIIADVSAIAKETLDKIIRMEFDKTELKEKREEMKEKVLTGLEGKYKKVDMVMALEELEKKSIQHLILDEGKRPDGRGVKDIRDISSRVSLLPRTHGSALFTRGVTQALTVCTLGSPSMELLVQNMYGEFNKRFIHYYNFPPFSTGETGRMGAPKSREVGHGMLAEKALRAVIPSQTEFPYTVLLVSEVLSSSGSSSMAATCGSTLALMDAGVPIKEMVAGVGVGIITTDDFSNYKIMTDLAYLEDAYGFLDFKMTGSRNGVTAIQADMKVKGIPVEILKDIIAQSKEARMKVLDEMEKTISTPKDTVSKYAPKTTMLKINPEKIGMVIGSGGKVIKEIQETTQSEIFIEEDGTVIISAVDMENVQKAAKIVDGLTRELRTGEIFEGTVKDLLDFGALVEILPGRVGLMHVSEITNSYVKKVEDWYKPGDKVKVKVIGLGPEGKISLSHKALEPKSDDLEN
ncbi:MAG: Polyribonucleotide nucleotidyltransferase [candidate division WWE3 bacterium GW2011_GWD2_42_11]|uniref:Polyribonucleotide nucleotidyltransferase n=3 Tax=Katanobacteria TaxID=422282 RepID=A0A0G0YSW4_UNCKA|nr:MAG: Polyribonucleotide nucleotidyltransferase [candidate division WWE3 bacterium GW2011_GWC2_41_23]KKS29248.1 MAG: Polyribonucleotide nucleotidyltransferase [candidate division WWE3 bacterium GW2011_GWD2_42_11]KKS51287.1 MAG: Polyribonucleotide nucleotidyltransferase [candidate division WWE3 bacterium GW2011_GWE2_42_25]HAI63218.1 polyribonucleotide nucleotidyltransferase [candidate division WWE3 bacterium]HBI35829.1 polyribonucleotide nucleotidyltransferase [candidate division WWE3 bacteriu